MLLRKKKLRSDIPDYDMFRVRDSQEVAEYTDSIFKWMRESQDEYKMANAYVENPLGEKTISAQGRAQLIDFVEELHAVFDLIPEALFITISTIDRYLGLNKDILADVEDIQQVAVAAILTVSKYEDIIPPSLDELIKQMKKKTTREVILLRETSILNELQFQLTIPTSLRFLERFSRISPKYNSAMDFAEFVIEIANYDFDIVKNLRPSEIAAASLYIAGLATSGVSKWTKPLEHATGIKSADVKKIVSEHFVDLPKKVKETLKARNIFRKYQGYADGYPSLLE